MVDQKCAGCGTSIDDHNQGIELWNSWFCSTCFITHSAKLNKELTAEDIAILRMMGKELSGFLPPEPLEMVLAGFYRRTGGQKEVPAEELARCVGEIQRLVAFATFRKVMNLLKTWQGSFNEFVEGQEAEIAAAVKRLTSLS